MVEASEAIQQLSVLDYRSDTDFLLELKTKTESDRIIVARIKPGSTLHETVQVAAERIRASNPSALREADRVEIPVMSFDLSRDFDEITGKRLLNGSTELWLRQALQKIRFRLDERGALLESMGQLAWYPCDGDETAAKPKSRRMVCDGPFLLLLWQKQAKLPYFAFWIANAELLMPAQPR